MSHPKCRAGAGASRGAPPFGGAMLLMVLSLTAFWGCRSGSPESPGTAGFTAELVSVTGCKTGRTDAGPASFGGLECFEYSYDGSDLLVIRHVDFALNCCPGNIQVHVTVEEGTLRIAETEEPGSEPCDCICLYDSEVEISGIAPGAFHVVFDDIYSGPDPVLEGVIDLAAEPSGSFCVERSTYPW